MKHYITATLALAAMLTSNAYTVHNSIISNDTLRVDAIGPNAYRVHYLPANSRAPYDLTYLKSDTYQGDTKGRIEVDETTNLISVYDKDGNLLFKETGRDITPNGDYWEASITLASPQEESLYGTGQFQDGYLDIKGLSRRLTQVNTQISVPVVISNNGYGIIWNNSGLTDFNPCDNHSALTPIDSESTTVKVNATGTEGNKQEERTSQMFTMTLDIPVSGDYSFLLDCGQSMSRKQYLEIDDKVLTQADNVWLPPTTSAKTHLEAGQHQVIVKGDRNDHPTLYWRLDDGTTTLSSPISQGIDYTVILGTPDEIIAQMRALTGEVPMLPKWALGYIHCRERYVSQDDVLSNAKEFRTRDIPIDMIVQDWQWWGKNGWNAMVFDADTYPDPKAMTDSLHNMDIRLMLSVWAKVDKNSELGNQMEADGHYIPNTDWIDFFNPESAEAYWTAYKSNLVPTGIDAWWQDATEPENDDLHGRMVCGGKLNGDEVRNIFPIAVNDRVYAGLCEERPDTRPMILTRSGAPGIQRYGVVTWSGDVGNDWETLRRQIVGGLGQMSTGLPWWTYDAGGFFRPGDQYTNDDYQQRMLRWIQTSVYLPFMRVHGYMSRTEPWRYSDDTYTDFVGSIKQRYRLVPYLYSQAVAVSQDGGTLMRPLVFDFAKDPEALKQDTQYMLGQNLLVCPVTSPASEALIYLPEVKGGWYDLYTDEHIDRSGYITVTLSEDHIPVYVRAGSIMPWIENVDGIRSTADIDNLPELTIKIYPGADGNFTLYEDDGTSNQYRDGEYLKTNIKWDDSTGSVTMETEGNYRPARELRVKNVK